MGQLGAGAIKQLGVDNAYSDEFRERMRILYTRIRMADKLKQLKTIFEHETLLWTGIALLRADARVEN